MFACVRISWRNRKLSHHFGARDAVTAKTITPTKQVHAGVRAIRTENIVRALGLSPANTMKGFGGHSMDDAKIKDFLNLLPEELRQQFREAHAAHNPRRYIEVVG